MSGEVIDMPGQGNATSTGAEAAGAPVPSLPNVDLMYQQLDTLIEALRVGLEQAAIRTPAGSVPSDTLNGFLQQFGSLEQEAVELERRLDNRAEGELLSIQRDINSLQDQVEGYVQAVEGATQHLRLAPTRAALQGVGATDAGGSRTLLFVGLGSLAIAGIGVLLYRASR